MQETITTTPDDQLPPSRPRRLRLIALALALALFAPFAYVAYQNLSDSTPNPDPGPNGLPEPNFSLTDEEAIARFQELNEVRVRAYETADITLVSGFAGPGPFKQKVLEEIRQLQLDNATAKSQIKQKEVTVTSNDPEIVTLRQVAVIDIRFFNADGEDITTKARPQLFTIAWTMRYFDQGWLLTESVATDVRPVE